MEYIIPGTELSCSLGKVFIKRETMVNSYHRYFDDSFHVSSLSSIMMLSLRLTILLLRWKQLSSLVVVALGCSYGNSSPR